MPAPVGSFITATQHGGVEEVHCKDITVYLPGLLLSQMQVYAFLLLLTKQFLIILKPFHKSKANRFCFSLQSLRCALTFVFRARRLVAVLVLGHMQITGHSFKKDRIHGFFTDDWLSRSRGSKLSPCHYASNTTFCEMLHFLQSPRNFGLTKDAETRNGRWTEVHGRTLKEVRRRKSSRSSEMLDGRLTVLRPAPTDWPMKMQHEMVYL